VSKEKIVSDSEIKIRNNLKYYYVHIHNNIVPLKEPNQTNNNKLNEAKQINETKKRTSQTKVQM
jgi:hypothetical protein